MTLSRAAGDVKLNGTPLKIYKDEQDRYAYQRRSVPKYDIKLNNDNASASENNQIEYRYSARDGFGDAVQTKGLDRYHYAGNMYFEHDGEIVMLPESYSPGVEDTGVTQSPNNPTASFFEVLINDNDGTRLKTYTLQDHRAAVLQSNTAGSNATIEIEKDFGAASATDSIVIDNVAYVGMGANFRHLNLISATNSGGFPLFTTGATDVSGSTSVSIAHNYSAGDLVRIVDSPNTTYNGIWQVSATGLTTTSFRVDAVAFAALPAGTTMSGTTHKMDKRPIRKFNDGVWSRDDNNYQSIVSVANNGAGRARFTTSANNFYTEGTQIYLVNMSVAAYNSMSVGSVSTLYTITNIASPTAFDVQAIAFTATATGLVNAQDSDIYAEHFCFAGDLLIRGYKDPSDGWVTSRVDPIASNPMLDTNWTAGIGTVGVGDANSEITDLVAIGDGEVVMKAEGVYTYKTDQSQFTNEVPELIAHRHPRNGRNSCEHKGWVYVPTVIGLLRYRNGQIQNVTPGRGGQSKYMTPTLPIGGVIGDAERLYAVTEPYKVYGAQHVLDENTAKVYVDYSGAGSADPFAQWTVDHETDLNGYVAATGYIYFGATKPWHSMYVEMDDIYNTNNYNTTYSALRIFGNNTGVQYWNGSAWTNRDFAVGGISGGGSTTTQVTDYTRVRNNSVNTGSSFGTSGEIICWGSVPSDWDTGGTTPLGADLGTTNGYYWTRFRLTADISNSVIIKRIMPGLHDALEMQPYDLVDFGGAQLVLGMTEEQGRGPVWQTLWTLNPYGYDNVVTEGFPINTSAGRTPVTTTVGTIGIIQPNVFRSGATGKRYLYVGGWRDILFDLGNKQDIPDSGVWRRADQYPHAFVVFPSTDCGLPYSQKELREINFHTENIPAADISLYIKEDETAWQGPFTLTSTSPVLTTAFGDFTGRRLAIALKINLSNTTDYSFPYAPRLTTMPALRVVPRPEMTEYIELSVELDADTKLRGQIDRREERTSYTALKTLAETVAAVDFVDLDGSSWKVHVMQISKKMVHSSDQLPRSIADIVLSVTPS